MKKCLLHTILGLGVTLYGWFFTVPAARAQATAEATSQSAERQGLFFQKDRVAILEVESAKLLPEQETGGLKGCTKTYQVTVVVKDSLPRSGKSTFQTVVRYDARGVWASLELGLEDWFPVKKGAAVVVAYNDRERQHAKNMQYLGTWTDQEKVWRSGTDGKGAWGDCKLFYQAVTSSDNQKDITQALTRTLKTNKKRLHRLFFELVEIYDYSVIESSAFSEAAAEYLRETAHSPEDRLEILDSLGEISCRDPGPERALSTAVVQLILEAHRNKEHPCIIRNGLDMFCRCFLDRNKKRATPILPTVSPKDREKLRSIVTDEKIIKDPLLCKQLLDWLDTEEKK